MYLHAFPPTPLSSHVPNRIMEERRELLLVAPYWPRAQAAMGLRLEQNVSAAVPGASAPERPPITDNLASSIRAVATQRLAPGTGKVAIGSRLPDSRSRSRGLEPFRPPLPVCIFEQWYASQGRDPSCCSLGVTLDFLQQMFMAGVRVPCTSLMPTWDVLVLCTPPSEPLLR